jgi:hypothetical protein
MGFDMTAIQILVNQYDGWVWTAMKKIQVLDL